MSPLEMCKTLMAGHVGALCTVFEPKVVRRAMREVLESEEVWLLQNQQNVEAVEQVTDDILRRGRG